MPAEGYCMGQLLSGSPEVGTFHPLMEGPETLAT